MQLHRAGLNSILAVELSRAPRGLLGSDQLGENTPIRVPIARQLQ